MTNTNHHQCFQSNYAASHETNKTDSVTNSECFQSSMLMVKNSMIQVTKKNIIYHTETETLKYIFLGAAICDIYDNVIHFVKKGFR